MSKHKGMHFLCEDDHQAQGMKKCMMKARRRTKRRGMGEFWGGQAALGVEQKHLEVFMSALTQRADRPNSCIILVLHNRPPSSHAHTWKASPEAKWKIIIKQTKHKISVKCLQMWGTSDQYEPGFYPGLVWKTDTRTQDPPSPLDSVRFPANSKVNSRLEQFSLPATSVWLQHLTASLQLFPFLTSSRHYCHCLFLFLLERTNVSAGDS